MDQDALVDQQVEDGRKLVEQLAQDGFDVTTAFWLKTTEDNQWFLYIASPVVDRKGGIKAYRRVYDVMRQMPQPFWIHPFEVKLIRSKDPLTKAVLNVQRSYSGRGGFRYGYGGSQLDGFSIEGAYLYPLPINTAD